VIGFDKNAGRTDILGQAPDELVFGGVKDGFGIRSSFMLPLIFDYFQIAVLH